MLFPAICICVYVYSILLVYIYQLLMMWNVFPYIYSSINIWCSSLVCVLTGDFFVICEKYLHSNSVDSLPSDMLQLGEGLLLCIFIQLDPIIFSFILSIQVVSYIKCFHSHYIINISVFLCLYLDLQFSQNFDVWYEIKIEFYFLLLINNFPNATEFFLH